jgi:hypothetical protein
LADRFDLDFNGAWRCFTGLDGSPVVAMMAE